MNITKGIPMPKGRETMRLASQAFGMLVLFDWMLSCGYTFGLGR